MQQPLIDGTTEKLTSPWHPDGHPGEHLSEHPGDAHAAPIGAQHGVAAGGGSTASLAAAFSGLVEGAGPHDKKTRSVAEVPLPKPRPDTKDGQDKAKPKPKEDEKPKQVPGVFPGVTDRTGTYGALADGKRASTQGVVLHRTESTTAAGTLAGYQDRINSGSHIGAQYLIDEKGATSLITPQDSRVYHAKGFNDASVGVEVVGPARSFDRSGKKGSIRDQITAMNLSPEFKARLLGYDDKQLGNVAKWNGDQIYEDISGAQKRSVWNLTSNLATQYGLDMGSTSKAGKDESGSNNYSLSTLPDFSAHEHINPKALGEGEPMIEFMRARKQYPELVAQAEKKLQEMQAAGARPEEMEKYAALVKREQDTLKALAVDGTQTELDAVKAEKDAKKPGAATTRENQRTDFYDHFYDRMGALKGALK